MPVAGAAALRRGSSRVLRRVRLSPARRAPTTTGRATAMVRMTTRPAMPMVRVMPTARVTTSATATIGMAAGRRTPPTWTASCRAPAEALIPQGESKNPGGRPPGFFAFVLSPRSECGDPREEQVAGHADQHEIDQERDGPAEIVPDHLALVAHELAGGDADARGLRRDRLADLGPDRVERRQQQRREAEQLADQRLELAKHGVGRGVAAG